jgi:hypothetical protein
LPDTLARSDRPLGRDEERGIGHAQRTENAFFEKAGKRLSGGSGDQHTLDMRAGRIHPGFAGLIQKRQSSQSAHPFIIIDRHHRVWRAEADNARSAIAR